MVVAERRMPGLERRLKAEIGGGVHFDRFSRGRYATDASHYQILPLGVVTPRTIEEAERAIEICRTEGVPVTPRGGGSSQSAQTINSSVIAVCSLGSSTSATPPHFAPSLRQS
ncbi:MAG: FAD-binding oxidoreductase, partial [Rhizobiales bacterium]|nr:FAD-binding oxidoreductase [Hyphomicrobiales bacterium]